jgi:1,4-alpha-glucan branching enzyme
MGLPARGPVRAHHPARPPHEFRDLVDAAHRKGPGRDPRLGAGAFPDRPHGLGWFDGTALYEHADPREGFHQDWNTLIYNYGRTEVKNFLVANAQYWLDEYHVDGLRVDAVASMLYRDYSRKAGEWVPNKDGGRENYEAIAMLQEMNTATYGAHPGIMTWPRKAPSFPGVSRPVDGGLGFGYKWNMGWMNDTLEYMKKDPVHRKHHHHQMTFGLTYAFTENFVLPISHDEVVHGKGSMLGKMPGGADQSVSPTCAPITRSCGGTRERSCCSWGRSSRNPANGTMMPSLTGPRWTIRATPGAAAGAGPQHALPGGARAACLRHRPGGFQWIEADDAANSVYSWIRRGGPERPQRGRGVQLHAVERPGYRVGLPAAGPMARGAEHRCGADLWRPGARQFRRRDRTVFADPHQGQARQRRGLPAATGRDAISRLTPVSPVVASIRTCHRCCPTRSLLRIFSRNLPLGLARPICAAERRRSPTPP